MTRLLLIAAALFIAFPVPALADSGSVTLGWDPNTEHDLAGYRIYYKTGSGGVPYNGKGLDQGDSPILLKLTDLDPPAPWVELTGLKENIRYFFVGTAFNRAGDESGYSNEVSFRVDGAADDGPATPPGDPAGMHVRTYRIMIDNDTSQ